MSRYSKFIESLLPAQAFVQLFQLRKAMIAVLEAS